MNASYQPYAPTPSLPARNTTLNLDTEVKLYTTPSQRELYESLAEIHAIIVTLEFLEKAFVRDSIPPSAYTPTCLRLLGQYKTLLSSESVKDAFVDLDTFKARYRVDCPAATRRLQTGLPATVEHPDTQPSLTTAPAVHPRPSSGLWQNVSPKAAAEATQNFITFMDALRLNYRAKDELHPLLASVITSVDAVTGGGDWEGRKDVVKWLIRLNQMRPQEEVGEEEGRECLWDIEKGYNSFLEGLG